jgi:hypothetical protein
MKEGAPFGIAGLWENWKEPATGEWIRRFAVVTTEANEMVAEIHGCGDPCARRLRSLAERRARSLRFDVPVSGGPGLWAADERPATCATGRKSLAEIAVAGRATPLAVPTTRSAISIADIPGFDSGHHWDAAPICRP